MIRRFRRLLYRTNSLFLDHSDTSINPVDKLPSKPNLKSPDEIRYSFPTNPHALFLDRHRLSFGEHLYQYISLITPILSLILLTSIPCYLLYYNSLIHDNVDVLSITDIAKYINGHAPNPCDNIIALYYLRNSWNLNFLYKKLSSLKSDNVLIALIDCRDNKGIPKDLERTLALDEVALHVYKFTPNDVSYAELDTSLNARDLIGQIKKII